MFNSFYNLFNCNLFNNVKLLYIQLMRSTFMYLWINITFVFWVNSVHWIKLWIDGIGELELSKHNHSLYDIFEEHLFRHLGWCDDVDGSKSSIYGSAHTLHGNFTPQFLAFFIFIIIILPQETIKTSLLHPRTKDLGQRHKQIHF